MVNPVELQKSLKGITFPAKKNHLICKAADNGADMEIIGFFHGLPDKEFNNPTEISELM
jgi:hypothetical protein